MAARKILSRSVPEIHSYVAGTSSNHQTNSPLLRAAAEDLYKSILCSTDRLGDHLAVCAVRTISFLAFSCVRVFDLVGCLTSQQHARIPQGRICLTSQQHARVPQGRICLTSQQHARVPQGRICLTSQQHASVSQGRICLTSQQHASVSQGRICLTSQQHASVSQGRICSDNCTRCHTETEVTDQT